MGGPDLGARARLAKRSWRRHLQAMTPIRLPRAVLAVEGADAELFLQNLLTNDLGDLAAQPSLYAGLLTPQGKLICDLFVTRTDGGLRLDAPIAAGADLLRRLRLFKLRARVELADVSAQVGVFADLEGAPGDPRLSAFGPRGLAPVADPPPAAEPDVYRALRLALGVPDPAVDAGPEEAFALEALLEELHGVDFHKGCFPGQENVSRMKRRATTRKKFCPVAFEGAAPAFGTPVLAGAAEIGATRSAGPGRAIAFLRLDRALEAQDALSIAGRPCRLDPPAWLILPNAEAAG